MYNLIAICNGSQKNTKQATNRVVLRHWNHSWDMAFAEIKRARTTSPILRYADFFSSINPEDRCKLQGLGAVLMQDQESGRLIIAYASRTLHFELFSNITLYSSFISFHAYFYFSYKQLGTLLPQVGEGVANSTRFEEGVANSTRLLIVENIFLYFSGYLSWYCLRLFVLYCNLCRQTMQGRIDRQISWCCIVYVEILTRPLATFL